MSEDGNLLMGRASSDRRGTRLAIEEGGEVEVEPPHPPRPAVGTHQAELGDHQGIELADHAELGRLLGEAVGIGFGGDDAGQGG